MDEEGACRGVMAWNLEDGTIHRFRAHTVVLATGGYGRAYFSCTSAHTCTGDGNAMVLRAGLPLPGHGVRAVPPDRHLRRRLPDHRGRARRGRLPDQFAKASASWSATPRPPRTSPRATWSARSMTIEIREGRGCGPHKDHILLHLEHLGADVLHERLPGISETAKIFAGVDVTKEPIPVLPTVHYNMGGIPTNYHGEVVTPDERRPGRGGARADGDRRGGVRVGARRQPAGLQLAARPRRVRPRGGATRGRDGAARRRAHAAAAAGRRGVAGPARPPAPCRGGIADGGDPARDAARHAESTARCSAPRRAWPRAWRRCRRGAASGATDMSVSDRSMIWNSDLVETLECDNLMGRRW